MLILASNSPRRKELISRYITRDFIVVPSSYNEEIDPHLSIIENNLLTAVNKGMDVSKKYPDDVVISADTMVVFNNKIYGKPSNVEEAKKFLREFSNNEHQVITSYFIKYKDKNISKTVLSTVKFKPLSEKFIDEYVASDSPLDKAGAYGIQDHLMEDKIEYYKGSLTNIIGLPMDELITDLKSLNL